MIERILTDVTAWAALSALWRTQQRSMTMAHSALNYDPTRRYDFKVEDVEYRRDSDQSWLAMVYQPQGNGPFPALVDIHGGARRSPKDWRPAVWSSSLSTSAAAVSTPTHRHLPTSTTRRAG